MFGFEVKKTLEKKVEGIQRFLVIKFSGDFPTLRSSDDRIGELQSKGPAMTASNDSDNIIARTGATFPAMMASKGTRVAGLLLPR